MIFPKFKNADKFKYMAKIGVAKTIDLWPRSRIHKINGYQIGTVNIEKRSFFIYRFLIGKLFVFEISSIDHCCNQPPIRE